MDEHAKVDDKLEPRLSKDELMHMYRVMLLARRFDERFLKLQRQGRIGTFPQASGQEAISMGVATLHLSKTIGMFWHFVNWPACHCGWALETVLLLWAGYEQGASPPPGVNDLPICVPVATQLLHAAGIGMAMNIKGDKSVVLAYFGDGAASEGDGHEAMNFASVFKAPVVFVCATINGPFPFP